MNTVRTHGNRAATRNILLLAGGALSFYALLAVAGDLRARPALLITGSAALSAAMVLAWLQARGCGESGWRVVLIAALLFRIVAALGPPSLSDDVYRYVWDGRVQLEGFHPYLHAPTADELVPLRDDDWNRINHPQVRTIYPPLAQGFFAVAAGLGAGTRGFKFALGVLDFGVVLALAWLLRRTGLPRERCVWYAWNPLAVLETAGSGHLEPLGVLFVVLGLVALYGGRRWFAGAALAAAIQVKLVPLVLFPGWSRGFGVAGLIALVLASGLFAAPYALTGPPVGGGLFEYAERWEYNATLFSGTRESLEWLDVGERLKSLLQAVRARFDPDWMPWPFLYEHVWPPYVARLLVGLVALGWIAWVVIRLRAEPIREAFLVLAGVLLLSPTIHPWYLLWALPLAAVLHSWPWILFAMLVPLAYLAPAGQDVPWPLRLAIVVPPAALAVLRWWRSREAEGHSQPSRMRRRRGSMQA